MRASVLTLSLFVAPTLACAEPRLSGDDESAVVTADHAEWTGAQPEARGDVIEIPLEAGALSSHITLDDKVVKRIDVAVEGTPRLIVRLHHSKATTLRTAQLMQIANVDGAIRVSFPREPGHAAPTTSDSAKPEKAEAAKTEAAKAEVAVKAPEPTVKVDKAAAASAGTPRLTAQREADVKIETPVAMAPAAITVPTPPAFADEPKSSGGRIWSTLVVLVLAAGAVVYGILRKKGASVTKSEEFRVIASRTLGPKSKLFMVEVEDKKLLFAVDDKGTRLVSTFVKSRAADGAKHEVPADMNAMIDEEHDTEGFAKIDPNEFDTSEAFATQKSESPAVAGLLKLRQQHGIDTMDSGDADDRADVDWAEMLLRATNRRGQS